MKDIECWSLELRICPVCNKSQKRKGGHEEDGAWGRLTGGLYLLEVETSDLTIP